MKAPYRLLYNSDTTHILGNVSPYNLISAVSGKGPAAQLHEKSEIALTPEMLDASVKEAADAGADAYSFCAGLCWVPWWPSEEFPAREHIDWFVNDFKGLHTTNPYYDYVFRNPTGTYGDAHRDIIQEQINSCRKYGVDAILSYRMNDAHFSQRTNRASANVANTPRIQIDHPEWQQSEGTMFERSLFDYRFPEYREFRLRMIRELIRRYEIDGFEMDFMRWHKIFTACRTTSEERLAIMTDFIRQIRMELDEATRRDGRYRHLIARIPAWVTSHDSMGLDPAAWAEAGVTIFNCSASHYTVQNPEINLIKAQVPNTPVYYELCHTVGVAAHDASPYYVNQGICAFRRTAVEQLYTTAHIAYQQGADGISLFNFQYYRGEPGSPTDDNDNVDFVNEPPFFAVRNLKDAAFLEKQPQHYFVGRTDKRTFNPTWQMPRLMGKGANAVFALRLYEPKDGWRQDGLLRIQSEVSMGDAVYTAIVNGVEVPLLTEDPGEPYPNPYTTCLGTADTRRCFRVPRTLLHGDGDNEVEIVQVAGGSTFISYLDLSIQ